MFKYLFITFLLMLASVYIKAQDNYEIQVYGSETVDPGHTMLELHSNYTFNGSKTIIDGVFAYQSCFS